MFPFSFPLFFVTLQVCVSSKFYVWAALCVCAHSHHACSCTLCKMMDPSFLFFQKCWVSKQAHQNSLHNRWNCLLILLGTAGWNSCCCYNPYNPAEKFLAPMTQLQLSDSWLCQPCKELSKFWYRKHCTILQYTATEIQSNFWSYQCLIRKPMALILSE